MEQACCSAAVTRPGVASLGCSQDARPHMTFARSWLLCCCIRAATTSRRYGIADGAYPKVPQAQMIEDRLRGVRRDCFLAICMHSPDISLLELAHTSVLEVKGRSLTAEAGATPSAYKHSSHLLTGLTQSRSRGM